MNINILDECPVVAAIMSCDNHSNKMTTESMQQVVSALLINGADPAMMPLTKSTGKPHKGGYRNHPCTRWAAECFGNFNWLFRHTQALCDTYKERYGKTHFVQGQLDHLQRKVVMFAHFPFDKQGLDRTPFVRALNQSQGRNLDLLDTKKYTAVEAYRTFYMREKSGFARWDKGVPAPHWWNPTEVI